MNTDSQNPQRDLLRVCRIGRAQGLKGEVNVTSFTDSPGIRFAIGSHLLTAAVEGAATANVADAASTPDFVVATSRKYKDRWILHFEGIEDRTAAETLNGITLFIDRAAGSAGKIESQRTSGSVNNDNCDTRSNTDTDTDTTDDIYFVDLIGLSARLADGTPLGTVTDVIDGPQSLLELTEPHGSISLVPFVEQIVPTVDAEHGFIVLDPPGGLLSEAPQLSDRSTI